MGINWGQIATQGITTAGNIGADLLKNWASRPVLLKSKEPDTKDEGREKPAFKYIRAKIVRDTEKSPQYGKGGKTKFGYDEYVVWQDGEKTLLHTEKAASGTLYRTEGRYEIGSQMPDISATSREILMDKVERRYSEMQAQYKPTEKPTAPSLTAKPSFAMPSSEGSKIELPTREEVNQELKQDLEMELNRLERDFSRGLLIAGKPCDCFNHRHWPRIKGIIIELIPYNPDKPYHEMTEWFEDNLHKGTPEAIVSGKYKMEYPYMARKMKEFRKLFLGTQAPLINRPTVIVNKIQEVDEITLEQAKEIAAQEAAAKVESLWNSQEQKLKK